MARRKASDTTVGAPKRRRSTRRAAEVSSTTAEAGSTTSKKRAAEESADEHVQRGSSNSKKKVKSIENEQEQDEKPEHIDIGDVLPTLTLKNEQGEDIQIADIASEKGVVIFLVPKADTPGCTNQACGFRDIYSEFTTLDYDVYCLSADTSAAQTKWQTKKELPYHLISDPKRVFITALGAGEGGKTKRSHFVFEKGGKLLDKKIPVKPVDSPRLALEFIKSL